MHPADIKAALQKKGLTQTQVALMAKRRTGHAHKSAVSRVIAGDLKSADLAQLIARLIDSPISQIWPGKYPQLAMLEKLSPRLVSAAQTKAEIQQLNTRRSSGRKAAA
jgi:lambda repressor-like predicted transcriptional regulator